MAYAFRCVSKVFVLIHPCVIASVALCRACTSFGAEVPSASDTNYYLVAEWDCILYVFCRVSRTPNFQIKYASVLHTHNRTHKQTNIL